MAVKKDLVRAGHHGIPDGATVIDLGNAIDIIPLARRLKALGATRADRMIRVYDVEEPEFKRIAETVKLRVASLVAAKLAGHAVDDETARWLTGLDDRLTDKSRPLGLCPDASRTR